MAKKRASTKKAAAKPKQASIPGTERQGIPELDTLADKWIELKNKRTALSSKEAEAKKELVEGLRRHKKSLPKDKEGNRVYYHDSSDGTKRHDLKLVTQDEKFEFATTKLQNDE